MKSRLITRHLFAFFGIAMPMLSRLRKMKAPFVFVLLLLSLQPLPVNAAILCSNVFKGSQDPSAEVKDLATFGQAMTQGMLLNESQADLFEVYRKIFFGDPNTSVNNETLKSVLNILAEHPTLQKPHFREYEITTVEKVYETPESLNKYLKSQISTTGQVRSNLLQIEANLGFWRKILDYQDASLPDGLSKDQQKEFQRKAKERFENYLNRVISKTNRDLISDLKNDKEDYQKKTKALFQTLKYIQEWMEKKGRNTQSIRQAMVDLVHTVGFGNQATQVLLKDKNALEKIEGLKKILDERDAVAMDLGYAGHFQELQASLKIDFPTGLSKNESPSGNIQKLEKEVLAGNFVTKPSETVRVRSLSIQEAPFRSCLGGSDCSTRTYFSKALDPNYNYFTMTDLQNHSSGHVTVVLGEAQNPKTKQKEKVAFIDKLQNVPNSQIPNFLQAVSLSLAERGYKLGVPEQVGGHNGLSNMDTTLQYVDQEILPKLGQKLMSFIPHAHKYQFENAYSRAYEKLNVKIFDPRELDVDTDIRPGRSYENFLAEENLNKNKLVQDLLNFKNSDNPAEVQRYISSGQAMAQLQKLGIYSIEKFQNDLGQIIQRNDLSFSIRKQAALEALLLNNEIEQKSLSIDFKSFKEDERVQISAEIRQWLKSSDKRKKKFVESLDDKWSTAVQNGDIRTLESFTSLKLYDVNSRNESGFSVLLQAAYADQRAVVEWLIQNPKLDLTSKDEFGFNPIEQLRLVGQTEMADWIESKRPESRSRHFEVKERHADGTPIVDFVRIQPGRFRMGEGKQKVSVTLTKPFEVMSTKTTQKAWKDIVELIKEQFFGRLSEFIPADIASLKLDPSEYKGLENPVEQVSYNDITAWLKSLNALSKMDDPKIQKTLAELFPGHKKGDVYRLPTEAEWEFVARLRGLESREYLHGNTPEKLEDYAWIYSNSGDRPHPVGQKKPIIINGKPIYDIQGNIWELTSDWDRHDLLEGGIDPQGPDSGTQRVARGTSFSAHTRFLPISARTYTNPANRHHSSMGFRLVRSVR